MIPQELYKAYRRVAVELIRDNYTRLETKVPFQAKITIVDHAAVMPCEDGAFVDAQVWIPKDVAEEYARTMAFQRTVDEIHVRAMNEVVRIEVRDDDVLLTLRNNCQVHVSLDAIPRIGDVYGG
jgi:hypothetical protein